jgi:hypothetical protein
MIFPLSFAYADNVIPITLSSGMEKIQFDGKWSNELEWKPTSLYELHTDNGTIYLRTAHQDNFIYLMIDVMPGTDMPSEKDFATVCFDTQNDKTEFPNANDFCFVSNLGKSNGIILKGNSSSYSEIKNTFGFIGIGAISDNNDRYYKTPHASYEFKIPTELVGRSNNYGFFFSVNEGNSQYSWPSNDMIYSPNKWGNLVSPDKSLPEFEVIWFVMIFGITIPIIFTRMNYL